MADQSTLKATRAGLVRSNSNHGAIRNPPGFEGQGLWVFYKATLCRCYSGKFDGLAIPNSVRNLWFNMSILPGFIFFVFPSLFLKNDPQGLKSSPTRLCTGLSENSAPSIPMDGSLSVSPLKLPFAGMIVHFRTNPTCKRYTPMVVGKPFEGMMVELMKSLWKNPPMTGSTQQTLRPGGSRVWGDRERFS